MATTRALINVIDNKKLHVAAGPSYRQAVFRHHLIGNSGEDMYKGGHDAVIAIDSKVEWQVRKKRRWSLHKSKVGSMEFSIFDFILR